MARPSGKSFKPLKSAVRALVKRVGDRREELSKPVMRLSVFRDGRGKRK